MLLLGGTTEAFGLAHRLARAPHIEVVTSFAGRTSAPARPAGEVRIGGFGGPDGLARYLQAEGVAAVVDATHPFAARMRWNALHACERVGVPRLRLERPGWQAGPGDRWVRVPDLAAAARALGELGARRVFLTIGRSDLDAFAGVAGTWFLVRSIEAPEPLPLARAEVVLDRGPFTLAGERALLVTHRVDALVTKDSGGEATSAKLAAARERGVPVVVVERPPSPPGPRARTVAEALVWLATALPATGA